jgi:Flp pilus assembly protein CpaB
LAVAQPARPRASSSRIFIIIGAVVALGAFGLVFFLSSTRGVGGGTGGSTKIVVAARDIPFRAALGKDDLALKDWPADGVPPNAYRSIDDVIGKSAAQATANPNGTAANATGAVAEIKISQGQPVTSNMLANSIDAVQIQAAFLPIPKGFDAATIPTGEQVGVAGYIQAGDYINIIATVLPGSLKPPGQAQPTATGPVTKTVFTNVHVLKVGAATGQVTSGGSAPASQQQGGVASSLTLVMTQCDWEFFRWLQANSTLTYTLGSYQDYKPQDTKPDPTCADATAAHGVGAASVDKRWNFTGTQ